MTRPTPIGAAASLQRIGQISREYELKANEFGPIARAAAEAEAEYRRIHAVTAYTAIHSEGASAAKAEMMANGDPKVAEACLQYKVTSAVADAAKAKLIQLRTAIDLGRTVISSEKEADKIHASGMSGAA